MEKLKEKIERDIYRNKTNIKVTPSKYTKIVEKEDK
jgi:hypothetical protein